MKQKNFMEQPAVDFEQAVVDGQAVEIKPAEEKLSAKVFKDLQADGQLDAGAGMNEKSMVADLEKAVELIERNAKLAKQAIKDNPDEYDQQAEPWLEVRIKKTKDGIAALGEFCARDNDGVIKEVFPCNIKLEKFRDNIQSEQNEKYLNDWAKTMAGGLAKIGENLGVKVQWFGYEKI